MEHENIFFSITRDSYIQYPNEYYYKYGYTVHKEDIYNLPSLKYVKIKQLDEIEINEVFGASFAKKNIYYTVFVIYHHNDFYNMINNIPLYHKSNDIKQYEKANHCIHIDSLINKLYTFNNWQITTKEFIDLLQIDIIHRDALIRYYDNVVHVIQNLTPLLINIKTFPDYKDGYAKNLTIFHIVHAIKQESESFNNIYYFNSVIHKY